MHVNHTSRRPVRFQPVSPSRSAQTCIENNSTNNKTPYKKNFEANFHQSRLANLGSRKGALVTQSAALSYPTDQLELKQQSCKEGSIELSPPPSSHGFERKRKHMRASARHGHLSNQQHPLPPKRFVIMSFSLLSFLIFSCFAPYY
ncbi:uncharacterized protein APUU_41033A [Aspergillus puulaauensis]|uniref:Uncharacterized protein n=1 Tax=Aspergillus puulaauensis TaxID=1220207 RepID=A0A7R7XNQ5_9EURO|nr:uncharacterized protein APUU_41033A [Aspergillus puulaauensis]BCS24589.1 hypothetical protein APUU_41033A [Aspergillus puulaauensis]